MADNTALVSMAQQFQGLPMQSLIGGPLKAAAEANANMAFTQTQFMLDTCFTKTADNESYNPIMIKMEIKRGVITPAATAGGAATIQQVSTTFDLPLLTIIPLNSLGVDNVDVTFEMEVKSSFAEEQSKETKTAFKGESSFEAKAGWGVFSVSIKGSASYDKQDSENHSTHYEKSNSAKYTVNVHAGQLPLPKGVNTIIEAFTKSIEPLTMPVPGDGGNNNNNNNNG